MKIGFAFLLLTCALLFPQQKPKENPLAVCINKCSISHGACLNAAKTDADKKACQKALGDCTGACNKK